MNLDEGRCECGARFVGAPLLEAPSPRPALGVAFGAIGLALLSALSLWKASLLALAPVAALLGVRAIKAARRDPSRFGGRRTALVGLTIASLVVVGIGGRLVLGIPRMLREREEARAAATRAQMYHLAGDLQRYRARYGAFPVRLSDLAKLDSDRGGAEVREVRDSRDWREQRISYVGYTGGLASTGRPAAFNTDYELRSPGPDGVLNTADDVLMRTGIVVDSHEDAAAPLVPPAETAPVPLDEPKARKRASRIPGPGSRGPGSMAPDSASARPHQSEWVIASYRTPAVPDPGPRTPDPYC
jgi:hypothetical protein